MMYQKHQYVRSKAMMEAYRKIECQHCGSNDGTVCGAHSNWGYGRGKGIKADDNRCASLCHRCHSLLDQGSRMSKDERVTMWTNAHRKTVRTLLSEGMWPKNVPVPDIRLMH
jgi:hypothetical protein